MAGRSDRRPKKRSDGDAPAASRHHQAIFDAAAEALILFDPGEPESVAELVTRMEAVAELFGEVPSDHPASVALACARRIADGDMVALSTIEKAYAAALTLAERLGEESQSGTPDPKTMPLADDIELLRDFGTRASEHLDDADEQLLVLEADPASAAAIDAVFRTFHTIKGMAGFLALDEISAFAHDAESLLADARRDGTRVGPDTVQSLFSAVDRMRELVANATGVGEPASTGAVSPSSARGDVAPAAGHAMSATPAKADAPASSSQTPASVREGTVRVEEGRLDGLLDTIGEMVIAESMVSAALRTGVDQHSIAVHLDRLDKITRELQQMATSLRMVPLRATFRRMGRLVRDVAHKSGKPVEFVVTGEDTELDKEVVDRIADPLVHALRNAVDHGIETAEERAAAGKPTTGRVELRAYHAGGAIHIEVVDDGRGLDPERILARARECGLVGADTVPDERAILDLVFEAGFSTAQTVTDVSGRGVGMDVVRRTVDELRGRIELDSVPGKGTTLSVRLPITLAIIDGMVARVGEERYVIPTLAIERSVRPTVDQVATVQGSGEMLVTDDGLVPIVRLHRLFGTEGAETDPTNAVIVITSDSGTRAGIMVCELLGQQQTVIKPLGEGLPPQRGITGGAIMPDGRVGLILDAPGLVRLARDAGALVGRGPHTKGRDDDTD